MEVNMNILITNIGRRGYLVDFIKQLNSFDGKVFVSDCDNTASGLYGNCDKSFLLSKPTENEKKYVEQLLYLCEQNNINLIIPVIDPEIYILSKYKEQFSKKRITVLVSDEEVLEICYSKVKMNKFLADNCFNVVKTFVDIESFIKAFEREEIRFPVFIKPILGSGSVDSIKVKNESELRAFFREGMIIQEFLEGQEYGVDTFVDDAGIPVRVVVKQKISMRSGETDKAVTVKNDNIQNEVIKLMKVLKPYGPIDTDVIQTPKEIFIIDLNPRFGGGYPATHMAGISFIELAIRLTQKQRILPEFNNYIVGQLTMKDVGIKTINISDDRYRRYAIE
jgi:carbamoyl-phosphate synthase large subunit